MKLMKCANLLVVALLLAGCSSARQEAKTLTLATTTSTRDSGLLGVLVPMFENKTGLDVKVVAVGSGQALELGRRGDADVLLTHAPAAERRFMTEGHGALRRGVMYNDFVLVGPPNDPAKIKGQHAVTEAFTDIARNKTPFISRGDESGTHIKEQQIWKKAEVEPRGQWYIRAGAGMAEALRMASEKQAYTLTDRGTFLALHDGLDLVILCAGDPLLRNPYAVIVVSARKHPGVNIEAARRFADFLLSAEVQRIIGEFGVQQFHQQLFHPLNNDV